MGPSGAGKSTLVNILAGYKIRGVDGTVKVNGRDRSKDPRENFSRLSCYIMQDDALRPALTVLEAMTLVAHLRLGYLTSHNQKKKQIFDLLDMLGLVEHAQTRTQSLSGGQKKRLSIALELITNPPVLFLDEPTTGLDSSSCSQCVSLLKLLAQQGRTVVCTIHQPSALLFEMFDHLYAVADGNCIYQGSIKGLIPFFKDMGLTCPAYHNPADYLIEVAIGEYDADVTVLVAEAAKSVGERRKLPKIITGANEEVIETISETTADCRQPPLQLASLASSEDSSIHEICEQSPVSASLFAQFSLLYYRNLMVLCRNYKHFMIRIGAHLVIGLVFGFLYRGVGSKADAVFANYVYLYGTTLFLVYTGTMAVTVSFPLEMNTLKKEYFNNWYSLVPCFLAVILVEIPIQILGSFIYIAVSYAYTEQPWEEYRILLFLMVCVTVTLTAQAAGFFIGVIAPLKIAVFLSPTIAVLLSTFGFNIFHHDIPSYFLWMYHISYFRAAFHSLVVSMYGQNRTTLPCEQLYCHYKYPEKFLYEMDIRDVDISDNTIYVSTVGLLLHVCTLLAIWFKLIRR
ncbi:ATP-binding cassette sub-family G member 1 isoform X2 [Zootermopsis nevadensis]|nr:ATP-binding cassette sub-family G member 1 isoform X2 [Zootermopsis nevadensis]